VVSDEELVRDEAADYCLPPELNTHLPRVDGGPERFFRGASHERIWRARRSMSDEWGTSEREALETSLSRLAVGLRSPKRRFRDTPESLLNDLVSSEVGTWTLRSASAFDVPANAPSTRGAVDTALQVGAILRQTVAVHEDRNLVDGPGGRDRVISYDDAIQNARAPELRAGVPICAVVHHDRVLD
jgi:hypothetical protein